MELEDTLPWKPGLVQDAAGGGVCDAGYLGNKPHTLTVRVSLLRLDPSWYSNRVLSVVCGIRSCWGGACGGAVLLVDLLTPSGRVM